MAAHRQCFPQLSRAEAPAGLGVRRLRVTRRYREYQRLRWASVPATCVDSGPGRCRAIFRCRRPTLPSSGSSGCTGLGASSPAVHPEYPRRIRPAEVWWTRRSRGGRDSPLPSSRRGASRSVWPASTWPLGRRSGRSAHPFAGETFVLPDLDWRRGGLQSPTEEPVVLLE